MTKARYQSGCITLRKRAKGPAVWQFRWWETDAAGNRVQRSERIGTLEQYPARRDAQKAAAALRLEINAELPHAVPITVATLVDRYLGDSYEMGRLAFSTRKSYTTHLKAWVKPKWGEHTLQQVRTMAVEQWLRDLSLAPRTKVHLRNTMHVLFECAARWELVAVNPITRVRQGGSRLVEPEVLAPGEFQLLLKCLQDEPMVRTMAILAGCMGLSRSELIGLKWADFDWTAGTLTVQRGVVHNHIGNTKTQARRKPVPLAAEVLAVLRQWRSLTPYCSEKDWVFASPTMNGKQPIWPDSVLTRIIKPAAKTAGLTKRIGWHTFRHSYSTLLRANGTDIKVQQELLRHSNVQTTLQIYTQAVSEQKRAAHSQVVTQLLSGESREVAIA